MYQTTNTLNLGGSFNYSAIEPLPEAHITRSKSRLKLYNASTVYLKDESHFEIELFNPKKVRVLAKIKVNGVHISGGGIIVNPGQRVYLERFIDVDRKFKFSTYEVEDSAESRRAIESNGEVSVDFFSESQYLTTLTTYAPLWSSSPAFGGTTVNNIYCASVTNAAGQVTYTNSVAGSLETGRVERGERSGQNLENSYGTFDARACAKYLYRILPESQRPIVAGEIRSYCTGCGTRIKKSNWKFCPSCGTQVAN